MVDNVSRKVTFVAIVLLVSLGFLLLKDQPFRMGLDLQGGTRLVYRFDFEQALKDDQITQQEYDDPQTLLDQINNIIRNRVDPTGLREASIRREGADRIVVELPGSPDISGVQAASTLGAALTDSYQVVLDLAEDNVEAATAFPETGGTVQIGNEKIHYNKREGTKLWDLERGYYSTPQAEHQVGDAVELSSDDAIRELIENLGELEFLIQADESDFPAGIGTDMASEIAKLDAWVAANPGVGIVNFNEVAEENGGPHPSIKWLPQTPKDEEQEAQTERQRSLPLRKPLDENETFAGNDVAKVYPASDSFGYPAAGFEMKPSRKGDFARFTGRNIDRTLVITLNDSIESVARIKSRLPGGGIIEGRFTQQEVRDLITVIRSGSLPIKPELEHEEVVGPTLGKKYVDRGMYSGLVGVLAVLVFMVFYYRRLGTFAAVALACSMTMLMGGLAFLQATLTLPGIAGIILTVGMAVDANILIFDRIREELDKGQNVKQAAKTGFEKAFSAIFDANITTLLTAIILWKVGTGPVRGFAVTLSIGIVGSMISALIITRLLVHWSLERGVKAFPMGTWLVKANYNFLSKAKICAAVSAVLVVLGLGFFIITPSQDKLGIDFLGGGEVQFNTEVAQDIDVIRSRVQDIPGEIGASATVKPVTDSSAGGDTYTAFRATFKVDQDKKEQGNVSKILESEIRANLGDLLQKGPVEVSEPRLDGAFADWDVTLYFVDEHPVADIHQQLTEQGLQEPALTARADRPSVYSGTLRSTSGLAMSVVKSTIQNAFNNAKDTNGAAFNLSLPVPSSSVVGEQVVGELRNKAIIALVVSLFVVVLYIRVRFAEYSYGFAAVAALAHDVLITLGVLTLVNKLGLINTEINLPMIAAFLTIIGYSLNDTIVIFDRVRENLPRMKKPLAEVLNISVNQTLSRTLLTSMTTLLAVFLLFAFNFGTGNTLEGFCFAMICGVLTGTYSTIFIANPVLLWLETRAAKKGGGLQAHVVASAGEKKGKKGEAKALTA